MPNSVKYSTTTPLNSLRKGNVAIGVNDVDMGPTTSTGWYNGVTPSGNYPIIYKTTALGDPDAFAPQSDQELYNFVIMQGGNSNNTTSVGAALTWIATQSDLFAVNNSLPNIVTDGLVLNLDAGEVGSYPTTGTPWYDLSGDGNNGTLTNGPTFNTNGWFDFDGADDWVQLSSLALSTTAYTKIAWFNPDGSTNNIISGGGDGQHAFWMGGTATNLKAGHNGTWDRVNYSPGTMTGKWWCGAVTFSNQTGWKLYINGEVVDTDTNTQTFTGGTAVRIAAYTNAANLFNGQISTAQVYNRVLSDAEILQNYYQAPIVTDGLVLALDAGNLVSYESGSATTYSLTGSNSGTLTNGVGFDSANGGGWVFDGVDDYIDLGNLGLIQTDFAISFWYENGASKENFYFSTGYSAAGSILIFSDGVWINSSDVSGRLPGAPGQSIEGPTNIILTRTNGVAKWYKNGVEQGSLTYSGNITTGTNYTIGYALPRNKTTAYLEGKFYTLNIYNKGLTVAEVAQNYNSQKSRFTP